MSWSAHARFFHQLRVMLQAGLTIGDAVHQAAESAGSPYRARASLLRHELTSGQSLSSQLSAMHVPPFAVGLVKAGETSGHLPELCKELASHYEHNILLRNMIIGRLIYPLVLLHAAMFTQAIVLIFVYNWSFWSLLGIPVAFWVCVFFIAMCVRALPKSFVALRLLRWPFSSLMWPLFAANTCSVLRAALSAGMLFGDALELAGPTSGNLILADRLQAAGKDVRNGTLPNLTTALERCELPSLVTDLSRTGEKSGTLDEQLQRAATAMRESFRLRSEWTARVICGIIYGGAMLVAAFIVISFWMGYGAIISQVSQDLG